MNWLIPAHSVRSLSSRTVSTITCATYQTKSVTARIPFQISTRQISSTPLLKANKTPITPPITNSDKTPSPSAPKNPLPKAEIERPDYTPVQLSRPVGLEFPPEPGQNTGDDKRTLQEKRDDFVNWDKHLEKRRMLTKKISASYFQDFNAISREHKGKSWVAPPKLFRADKALYFPNLRGRTLNTDSTPVDLANVIVPPGSPGVSVVAVYSSAWGEKQVRSWLDEPDTVMTLLAAHKDRVQRVDINVEQNPLKALFVTLSVGGIRKSVPKERHDRYFIVKSGLSDEIREKMGVINARVGYLYLLDAEAKIRWAGSGYSTEEERQSLIRGIQKLVSEYQTKDLVKEVAEKKPEIPLSSVPIDPTHSTS